MPAAAKVSKEKIINAVLSCSFEKSVGGTSLSDIAGKLGIKKASLYNHYKSRDEMISDTVKYCGEYLKKIYFIPSDIESIAKKYSAGSVLKAIVNRWFKLNEKEPLLQINSFLESEKFYSDDVVQIISGQRKKITGQTALTLKKLSEAGKIIQITDGQALAYAGILSGTMQECLSAFIMKKKHEIRCSPDFGEDSLFSSVPSESSNYNEIDRIVLDFCQLLKK